MGSMPHRSDPYRELYSQRTAGMTGSEIRALFAVLERPEIISLAGGLPWTEPVVDRVADCVAAVLAGSGSRALQYGPGTGVLPLRERLVDLMATEGIEADPHHLVVTDGAQQGLHLLAEIFVDPGDIVLTEAPTYVGALDAFASFQADVRGIPMDDDGITADGLAEAIDRLRAEGRTAKFLYLVPTFQNPSGVTLAPERREPILEICRTEDLLVVEDNPYAQVRFEGEPVTPLRALAPEQVIYLGTLSKVFSPGMRIGWVLAPEPVRDRLVLAKEAANLCSSPFTQLIAVEYLGSPHLPEDLDLIRKTYRERRDAMLDALDSHFPPQARTRPPEGGLFLWVTLPPPIDTKTMLARALEAGAAYVPGQGFYPVKRDGRHAMRLNFSYPSISEIEEGMRRLGAVVTDELELARSLGG
jgi:DNA-binding transcriptional MocR family regulator